MTAQRMQHMTALATSLAATLFLCATTSALAQTQTLSPPHQVAVIYANLDTSTAVDFVAPANAIEAIEAGSGFSIAQLPTLIADSLLAEARHGAGPVRQALAGDGGIAVLFPDIGEPYRSIFRRIIEGIEDKARTKVASIPVLPNTDPAELAAELRRQDIRVVIALGKQGLKAAAALDRSFDIVAGAVLSIGDPEARDNTVISLAPDPALLFARLKTLQPGIQRVTVVYDPQINEWLVRLARTAAKAQGVELNALPAGDLKTALKQYRDFFATSTRADALWLPQDNTTADEATIVPLLLKEAWDRGMPLFSSSLAHVRRGALFSLYPDNLELGKELANSALAYLGSGNRPSKGMLPLRVVMAAVNTRTAGHLGINLRQQNFDLLLPDQ